jgi:hypothetical protein
VAVLGGVQGSGTDDAAGGGGEAIDVDSGDNEDEQPDPPIRYSFGVDKHGN